MPPAPVSRKSHAGPGDIRGGEAYRPLVGGKAIYAVDRVFQKAGVWTVIYHVRGGDFDGHCCESTQDEFRARVKP